jgi:hypothetical protein
VADRRLFSAILIRICHVIGTEFMTVFVMIENTQVVPKVFLGRKMALKNTTFFCAVHVEAIADDR